MKVARCMLWVGVANSIVGVAACLVAILIGGPGVPIGAIPMVIHLMLLRYFIGELAGVRPTGRRGSDEQENK